MLRRRAAAARRFESPSLPTTVALTAVGTASAGQALRESPIKFTHAGAAGARAASPGALQHRHRGQHRRLTAARPATALFQSHHRHHRRDAADENASATASLPPAVESRTASPRPAVSVRVAMVSFDLNCRICVVLHGNPFNRLIADGQGCDLFPHLVQEPCRDLWVDEHPRGGREPAQTPQRRQLTGDLGHTSTAFPS